MEENEVFWDAQTPEVDQEPYYFDPEDPEEDIQLSFAHLELFPERYQEDHNNDIPDHDVSAFLAHLSYDDLTSQKTTNPEYFGLPGTGNHDKKVDDDFDSFVFSTKSWHIVLYDKIDPKKVQPYLGFQPL